MENRMSSYEQYAKEYFGQLKGYTITDLNWKKKMT